MQKQSLAPQRGFFPQPVYAIGTYKDDGTPNFALITWVTFCSVNPPLFLFGSRGKKLTRELVEKNGMFSANLVTADMMYMADYFGTASGRDKNKCKEIDVKTVEGSILHVPVLDASPWVYECLLADVIARGDGYVYIGHIQNILADESIKDAGYGKIDMRGIDPLVYAPGHYYRLTRDIGAVGCSKTDPDGGR